VGSGNAEVGVTGNAIRAGSIEQSAKGIGHSAEGIAA